MNRQQAIDSLRPIFVLQYFTEKDVDPYCDVIMDSCGWMDGLRFKEIVSELAKEIKTNVRLKPAHFIGKYKEIAEERHWASAPAKVCSSCVGGTGFVYIWVRRKGTREEFRAMKPCPDCRGLSTLKEELEEIAAPQTQAEFDWAQIKPDAARWMLSLIERSEDWKFPDEYVRRLCEIAGTEESIGGCAPADQAARAVGVEQSAPSVPVAEVVDDPPEF